MPRKHRHRTMKGGFLDSLTQGLSDAWSSTKKATSDAYNSATGSSTDSSSYTPSTTTYPPPSTSSSGYMGGRKRTRKHRKMRAGMFKALGLSDNKDRINITPFSRAMNHDWTQGAPQNEKMTMGLSDNKGRINITPFSKAMNHDWTQGAPGKEDEGDSSGGRRKKSRKMRGGYSDNIALTGLAARAAPISDIKSAQPLTTVGGRRTKRRRGGKHRHSKSCKHSRY